MKNGGYSNVGDVNMATNLRCQRQHEYVRRQHHEVVININRYQHAVAPNTMLGHNDMRVIGNIVKLERF